MRPPGHPLLQHLPDATGVPVICRSLAAGLRRPGAGWITVTCLLMTAVGCGGGPTSSSDVGPVDAGDSADSWGPDIETDTGPGDVEVDDADGHEPPFDATSDDAMTDAEVAAGDAFAGPDSEVEDAQHGDSDGNTSGVDATETGDAGDPLDASDGVSDDASDATWSGDIAADVEPDVFHDDAEDAEVGGADADVGADGADAGLEDDADSGPPPPFESHTVDGFDSLEDYLAFAAPTTSVAELCKFTITSFGSPDAEVFYMWPGHYSLHDEFYWYRLLNGVAIPGWPVEPLVGQTFPTIDSIYAEYLGVPADELPIGLAWAGTRLYAPAFYSNALSPDRFFAAGALLYWPEDAERVVPEALWTFDLEFVDKLDEALLQTYFDHLEDTLPPSIAAELKWLPRSHGQEEVAGELIAAGGSLSDRIIFFSDLATATGGQVLAPGLTAGRIEVIPAELVGAAGLDHTTIVVSESLPSPMPPVAGIVLSSWTPPLADVVRDAASLGVPVAWMPGAHDDPGIQDWAKFGQPVILEVPESYLAGGLSARWHAMSKEDHTLWQVVASAVPESLELPSAGGDAPLWADLVGGVDPALTEMLGGRALGAAAVSALGPPVSIGVTTAAFEAHHASLQAVLIQAFNQAYFKSNPRARFAVLEGLEAFEAEHAWDPWALAWLASFEVAYPASSTLGSLAAGGGLVGVVAGFPPPAEVVSALEQDAAPLLAVLDPSVPLSLRPSGLAAGVRGLHAASHHLPEVIVPPGGDLGGGLAELWASWWRFEAFQARDRAGLEMNTGGMGVLVQPALDPDKTLAAGVARVRVGEWSTSVELIAQVPTASAARPAPGEISEHVEVSLYPGSGTVVITRHQGSSYQPEGEWLLDDPTLEALVAEAAGWGAGWLADVNADLSPLQAWGAIDVDVTFALVDAGWPALASGETLPARVVLRDALRVTPRLQVSAEVEAMDIPRDLLPRIREVRATTCTCEGVIVETVDVWTGPTWCPPAPEGFGQNGCPEPEFNPFIRFTFTADIAEAGVSAGEVYELDHSQAGIWHPFMHHGGYDIAGEIGEGAGGPVEAWDMLDGGWCTVSLTGAPWLQLGDASCDHDLVYQSNEQWLAWLVAP